MPRVPKPGDDNAAGCPSTTSFVLSRSVCMMHGINGAKKWEIFRGFSPVGVTKKRLRETIIVTGTG